MSDLGTPASDGGALGGIISPREIKSDFAESKAERSFLQNKAQALPGQLKAIESKKASDIAALGPIPQLSPEEMRSYLGQAPQPQSTSLIEQWGSPAMLIAALGAAFTRMPLTNALNAGAQVMKAYQARDFEAAQEAFKEWKHHNDTALKLLDIQSNAYSNAVKAIKESSGEERKDAIAEFTALTHAFGDKVAIDAIRAGNLGNAIDHTENAEYWKGKLQASKQPIEDAQAAGRKYYDAVQDLKRATESGDPESIKTATAAVEEAKKDFDLRSQIASEGKGKTSAGAGGETKAQTSLNAKITTARDALQKLVNGENAQYESYDLTPEDVRQAEGFNPSQLMFASDKIKAVARMRKLAGTPIVHGNEAEAVPEFKAQPKEAPAEGESEAAAAGVKTAPAPEKGGPPSKDAVAVPPAYASAPDGTQLRKEGKVWVKKGGWLIPSEQNPIDTSQTQLQ